MIANVAWNPHGQAFLEGGSLKYGSLDSLAGCDPKPREEVVRAVYCKCPEIPTLAR